MKVITGTHRGRVLETLEGEETRPTTQRVKEGLFSAIQFEIEGRQVLDLFAGSGQLGIEALSRGAAGCLFIDRNPDAAAVIRRNLVTLGLTANTRVVCQDAMAYLAHAKEPFDLVFLDPPYAAELLEPALTAVVPLVREGGIIVCESDTDAPLPEQVGGASLYRRYQYSRVTVRVYRVGSR